nr:hypothetical protein [uncultured Mediterranean phage uvMED]
MDFIIGIILGYFLQDISFYLKRLSNYAKIDKEFKTIVDLDNEWNADDLP